MDAGQALTPDQVVSLNLKSARDLRDWTQQRAAAEISRYLGEAWSAPVYAAAEGSHRTSRVKRFSATELVAFSRAFRLPLAWWFLPPEPLARIIPRGASAEDAALTGDELLSLVFPRLDDPMAADLEQATERLFSMFAALGPRAQNTATYLDWVRRQSASLWTMLLAQFKAQDLEALPGTLEDAATRLRHAFDLVVNDLQHEGMPQPQPPATIGESMTEPVSTPEPQPVAAAIVTSSRGVLAGKRNDGKPPWTFIAGEVEPGETAPFAAVREVKEETGLEARAGHEIGRRVHPKTGRTMIYIAAEPVRPDDLEVFVGDPRELAEVRWLSLAEADELLPGMFEPVHDHLERTLTRSE